MSNKIPKVYCKYSISGKELNQLLEESFRVYLIRVLNSNDFKFKNQTALYLK